MKGTGALHAMTGHSTASAAYHSRHMHSTARQSWHSTHQDEDGRVFEDGPRKRNALLLAAAAQHRGRWKPVCNNQLCQLRSQCMAHRHRRTKGARPCDRSAHLLAPTVMPTSMAPLMRT